MSPTQVATAWVTYRRGGEEVRVDLDRPKVVFGRSSNCDVLLSLKGVSRAHYVIERGDDGWVVSDLNSTNGTYVNQALATRQRLNDGDQITLGPPGLVPITLVFRQQMLEAQEDGAVGFEEDEGRAPPVRHAISMEEQPPESGKVERLVRKVFPDAVQGPGGRQGAWPIGFFTRVGKLLLATELDLDGMLQQVLDLAFEYLPVERGSIWMTNEGAGSVTVRASRNTIDPPGTQVNISRSIVNAAVRSKQAILVTDAGHDLRFAGAMSIDAMNIRSAMCAPLYHEGRVRGFMYLDSRSHWMSFAETHLELLTALAIFTAVGLELKARIPPKPAPAPDPPTPDE